MYNCPTFFLFWKCLADRSYWTHLYLTVADNELHFFTISNLNYTVFVSLALMFLVVVHSSQLYSKIHSANTLKWRIFCDNVRYLLLYTWLFSFMVLMVIIFRRCMSSLVSIRLPSSLHLRQESFPLIGVASGTVYYSVLCSFTCRLYA